jgi:hypothetical protein
MNRMDSIRRWMSFSLLGGGMAVAQSSALPATTPTAGAATVAAGVAATAAADQAKPAEVVYAHGLLQVAADDSSLNQILRTISRQTGMKITGGVADQRVYGMYGPGVPAAILAKLLDGAGSNMLLRQTAADAPMELVLTPRLGGPTPPQPSQDDSGASSDGFVSTTPRTVAPGWGGLPSAGNPTGSGSAPPLTDYQAQAQRLQQMQKMQQQQSQMPQH